MELVSELEKRMDSELVSVLVLEKQLVLELALVLESGLGLV
jgi:hypothetical protein